MFDNKAKVLFVAEYPNEHTIREGMAQRIVAIDKQFVHHSRVYLQVSHRFFTKRQIIVLSPDSVQYKCNLFLHFFFILNLFLKSSLTYFHSIQSVLPVLLSLFFVPPNKKMVIDLHGVVPEEHILAGQPMKAKFYAFAERYIFKRLLLAICVTRSMETHFRNKYPWTKSTFLNYPIFPSNINDEGYAGMEANDDRFINVVYSGNLQVWQNIDQMVDVISKNLAANIRYFILTGSPVEMLQTLKQRGLSEAENVYVDSVSPGELRNYYAKSHYGFILRDDIVVNRVACPTKMVEYMHYGIIPIVKCSRIGDFYDLKYEFLQVEAFGAEKLERRKSERNHLIIAGLKDSSRTMNVRSFLGELLK